VFTWSRPGQSQVLRDDVLREAVDIEGVARDLLEDEAQASQKGKEKAKENENTSKKLPKWLGKLSKK
jgi:hypothetical protein